MAYSNEPYVLEDSAFSEQRTTTQEDGESLSGSDSDTQNGSSRKRKRPTNVTCEACKSRKVRCDRAQPACGWCARNDQVCEYRQRKKPGLRAGYGRELEGRLDRLEALLDEHGRQLSTLLSEAGSSPEGKASHHSGRTGPTPTDQAFVIDELRNKDNNSFRPTPIDSHLASSSGKRNLADKPTPYATNFNKDQIHAHFTSPVLSQSLTSSHAADEPRVYSNTLNGQAAPLPPYDLLYSLVDLYFKHINIWLPLLDRKATFERLFGLSVLDESDRILLHAIVAAAIRFCNDPRLTQENRQLFHNSSKQQVQLYALENSTVRSLQALAVLALDVTGTTNGPPGWNLMSLLCRSVVQLGLAVETTSPLAAPTYPSIATLRANVLPEAKSWIEDEERRRLFWTVYLLDRYVTIATAFDFALDEKEVDRRFPCTDHAFAANRFVETPWFRSATKEPAMYGSGSNLLRGHFSYHCELMGILSQIHQFLKRPVDISSVADVEEWQNSYRSLDGKLNEWNFALPDDFVNVERIMKANARLDTGHCGWIMLHGAYWLTVIRLNSSAAYPAQSSPFFSSSYSAMQRCIRAVENIKQLAHSTRSSGLLDKLGPPFAFSIWVAARVTLVHGSTMDHDIDPDIGFFVSILSELGASWEAAQRYSEILDRVLGEYQQSRRSMGPTGARVTPSTVGILADMRRCAYDLDFLITRQPHNSIKSHQPTRANSPAPNELEYLDVFDLFNFPRLPATVEAMEESQMQPLQTVTGTESAVNPSMLLQFAIPNPEADWLFHAQ